MSGGGDREGDEEPMALTRNEREMLHDTHERVIRIDERVAESIRRQERTQTELGEVRNMAEENRRRLAKRGGEDTGETASTRRWVKVIGTLVAILTLALSVIGVMLATGGV